MIFKSDNMYITMSFKTADVKFLRWESIVDKYLIDLLNEFNTV